MVPDRCGYTDALQEQKFSAIKNTKKKKKISYHQNYREDSWLK